MSFGGTTGVGVGVGVHVGVITKAVFVWVDVRSVSIEGISGVGPGVDDEQPAKRNKIIIDSVTTICLFTTRAPPAQYLTAS